MPTDRRAHPRQPVTATSGVNLYSLAGLLLGVAVPADVSRSGIRADVTRGYAVGEALRLEVRGPHRLARRQFPFVVAWAAHGPDGWQIGGAFTQELTDAEADALADG
jgi:hypothetical protein